MCKFIATEREWITVQHVFAMEMCEKALRECDAVASAVGVYVVSMGTCEIWGGGGESRGGRMW